MGAVVMSAGSAAGQITRAGAVGTVSPVPTAGVGRVPGGATFRPFTHHHGHHGTCGHLHGKFVHDSTGLLAGGRIVVKSKVRVGIGSGLPAHACVHGVWPWWDCSCAAYRRGTYGYGPLWGVDGRVYVDGRPGSVAVPEPPVDEGVEALRARRFAFARVVYLERATARVDAEGSGEEAGVDRRALRLAGLAAAGEGRYDEAERLFEDAYGADGTLAGEPLEGATLVGGTRAMREIVNGAVAHAHRVGRAASWEMVAWLMQAEGRHDRARAMMARAERLREEGEGARADAGRFAAMER